MQEPARSPLRGKNFHQDSEFREQGRGVRSLGSLGAVPARKRTMIRREQTRQIPVFPEGAGESQHET